MLAPLARICPSSSPLALPRAITRTSTSTRSSSSSRNSSAPARCSSHALRKSRKPSRHPGQPPPAAGCRPVGDHELDLRMRPLDRAVVPRAPRPRRSSARGQRSPGTSAKYPRLGIWRPCTARRSRLVASAQIEKRVGRRQTSRQWLEVARQGTFSKGFGRLVDSSHKENTTLGLVLNREDNCPSLDLPPAPSSRSPGASCQRCS